MLLIRCAFWMTLVVLLLPANGAETVFGPGDTSPEPVAGSGADGRDTLRADDLEAPWQGPDHSG